MIVLGHEEALVRREMVSEIESTSRLADVPTQKTLTSELSWQLTAVQLFSQTGNLAAVARELGMSIYELQKLTRTQCWIRPWSPWRTGWTMGIR